MNDPKLEEFLLQLFNHNNKHNVVMHKDGDTTHFISKAATEKDIEEIKKQINTAIPFKKRLGGKL
jgi:glutamate-1-semialdehyde aminotransferase